MQQSNKNKQIRNNRILSLRQNLKKSPILHKTIDRIQKLIAQQKTIQRQKKDVEKSQIQSIQLSQQREKIKSNNRHDFEAKYTIGRKIGQGAHGFVKQCFHKQTGKMYALKVIRSDNQFYYYLKRNFVNIIELDHPNIIKYKAFYFDMTKQTCLLVMEHEPYPNLSQIQIQSQEELKRIIYQVVLGLEYIHKKFLCHRDIKPENILYDRQNKKSIIIDFGVSCKYIERGSRKQMLTLTGTPYYRAPEMFTGGGYDQKVDLWSLGVLIYRLITKSTPFESEYHCDTINNILKGQITFDNKNWSLNSHLVKDLVIHLLKPKQTRLTIKQAKNHFWFQNLRQQEYGEDELTKSAGFQSFFTLKRTVTECKNNSFIRSRNPTLSPITALLSSPKLFSLQRYQKQEQNMRWISLEGSQQMDLIQSQDQQSSSSPTPRLKGKKAYMDRS